VVGWYSTGPKLRENDLEIHEVIRRYCPNPVLVIIDVQLKEELEIPTKSYITVEEVADVRFHLFSLLFFVSLSLSLSLSLPSRYL
jgi:dynactin complex subunit